MRYASSSFQRFINQVLSGTSSFCFAYIDDLVIFSSDDRQHKQHLHEIATRLNLYGLTLNMAKCVLGVNELVVLGYNLSAEGITATDHKIKAIKSFSEPTTIKELRRLLGLINYQRRFIPDAAAILAPLNSYPQGDVKNNSKISLNSSAKQALKRIKQEITQLVCLAHPRHDAQLQLKTDASNLGLGAVLEQVFDDTTEVLGYFSKSLTETQRKYSTYDLELLSIFSAVKHFEYMLLDKTFTIFCDNKPLVNSFRKPSQSNTPRQARQLSYLSQFDCMIQHLPGKSNTVADCLSRAAPLTICHISETSDLPISLKDLALEQQQFLNTDAFAFSANSSIWVVSVPVPDSDLHVLIHVSESFHRILLPPSMEQQIVSHYHNLNHLGIKATFKFIRARFVFKQIRKKIADFVRACVNCQRSIGML